MQRDASSDRSFWTLLLEIPILLALFSSSSHMSAGRARYGTYTEERSNNETSLLGEQASRIRKPAFGEVVSEKEPRKF